MDDNKNCGCKEGTLPDCAPLAMAYVPMQRSVKPVYSTAEALSRGTLFPGLDLPFMNMTMFNISVDEYIFPNKEVNKSSARRRLDAQLDNLDDKELSIVEATVNGLCKAKE